MNSRETKQPPKCFQQTQHKLLCDMVWEIKKNNNYNQNVKFHSLQSLFFFFLASFSPPQLAQVQRSADCNPADRQSRTLMLLTEHS